MLALLSVLGFSLASLGELLIVALVIGFLLYLFSLAPIPQLIKNVVYAIVAIVIIIAVIAHVTGAHNPLGAAALQGVL